MEKNETMEKLNSMLDKILNNTITDAELKQMEIDLEEATKHLVFHPIKEDLQK